MVEVRSEEMERYCKRLILNSIDSQFPLPCLPCLIRETALWPALAWSSLLNVEICPTKVERQPSQTKKRINDKITKKMLIAKIKRKKYKKLLLILNFKTSRGNFS